MKVLSRRELLKSIFSRDTIKEVYGAWHNFNNEMNDAKRLTGDEAIKEFARRLRKKSKLSEIIRKEGKS